MFDKEKQIKEMAKDCDYVAHLLRFNDPYMLSLKGWSELTKEMIKLGWIKPNEDSVVLSKERYNKLISLYDEIWDSYYDGENNAKVYYENIKIPQARKETAEKYICWLKENILFFGICGNGKLEGNISITLDQLEKFSEQFGDFSDKFIAKPQIKE